MKKIIFSLLLSTLISCQENRPHGSQYKLPELTENNHLMGYLNENRSNYRVSFYDINIEFDIERKSIHGFVTIKAESLNDLDRSSSPHQRIIKNFIIRFGTIFI